MKIKKSNELVLTETNSDGVGSFEFVVFVANFISYLSVKDAKTKNHTNPNNADAGII